MEENGHSAPLAHCDLQMEMVKKPEEGIEDALPLTSKTMWKR